MLCISTANVSKYFLISVKTYFPSHHQEISLVARRTKMDQDWKRMVGTSGAWSASPSPFFRCHWEFWVQKIKTYAKCEKAFQIGCFCPFQRRQGHLCEPDLTCYLLTQGWYQRTLLMKPLCVRIASTIRRTSLSSPGPAPSTHTHLSSDLRSPPYQWENGMTGSSTAVGRWRCDFGECSEARLQYHLFFQLSRVADMCYQKEKT